MKRLFFLIICLFLLLGCAPKAKIVPKPAADDQADYSCSYFYFLWGSNAELDEQFPEALEAYEKALICDPKASYIKEKIPILMLKMGDFDKAASWLAKAIQENPNNNTYKLFLANLFVQQERTDEAIILYRDVLHNDPDNEAVHVRLGLLHSHRKDYDTAEKIFRQLLERKSSSYFTRLSLARLLNQRKNYDAAIKEYEKVLSLNWSKELAYELGFLYVNRKKYNDALRIYTTITDKDKFDERGSLSRIQTLLDLGKLTEAMNELRRVRHFSKNPQRIDLVISKVYLRQKETEKAKKVLLRLVDESDKSEPKYMLALLAYQADDFPTSLKYLKDIDSSDDEFEEAVFLQSRILRKLNRPQQVVELLKEHIGDKESSSPLFYALLSSLYQDQKEQAEALGIMEAAVTVYPDNYQLFFEYGLLLERSGMYESALEKMKKVLELKPDHAEALNFIGYTWADRGLNLNRALKYVTKANELKPNNGFIIDSLGWVHFRLGNFEEAEKFLHQSLKLQPDDPHIYDHLGDTFRAQGENKKALEAYQQALEMFENKKKKKSVKEKIDALNK